MKRLMILARAALFAWLSLSPAALFAQGGFGSDPTAISWFLGNLFPTKTNFSCVIETELTFAGSPLKVLSGLVRRGSWLRTYVDYSKIQGTPSESGAIARNIGVNRMVTITRPDLNVKWTICPDVRAYVEKTGSGIETLPAGIQITRTNAGKEEFEGVKCIKWEGRLTGTNLSLLGTNQPAVEANPAEGAPEANPGHLLTVWESEKLPGFPLAMKLGSESEFVLLRFSTIKFDQPATNLFDLPKGLTKYPNFPALVQDMQRRYGTPKKK